MSLRPAWCLPWLLTLAACPSDDSPRDATDHATDGTDATETQDADATETQDADATEATDGTDAATDATADAEVGPAGCKTFDLTGDLVAKDAVGVFQLGGDLDLGLGGPLPDAVVFEFFSESTGTFDLSQSGNDNYKTCEQCVRFIEDIDPTGRAPSKNYFPRAGKITIDDATPPTGTTLKLTLARMELIEVTIRASDFQTTPVEGGGCYEREDNLVLETGVCQPQCGDHRCGPDGCGGVCGAGCAETEVCHLDGSECEETSTCVPIVLEGPLLPDLDNPGIYRIDVSDYGLGAIEPKDFVQVEFFDDTTGTVHLDSTKNRNYSTCKQCFRLIVDGRTELFQRSGDLVISDASVPTGDPATDGFVAFDMVGVVLGEVLLDEEFNSMALPNGRCVEIVDGPLSSPLPE